MFKGVISFIFILIIPYFIYKKIKKYEIWDIETLLIIIVFFISLLIFIASPFCLDIDKLRCSSYAQAIEATPFNNFHIGENTSLTNSSIYTFEVFANTTYSEDKIIYIDSFTFNVENNNGNSKITTVLYDNKPFSYK